MAKLKVIKDDKNQVPVPLEEPVLVELGPPEEVPTEEVETGLEEVEIAAEPERQPERKAPEKPADGADQLRRQLEAAQAAQSRSDADLAAERAKLAQAQKDLAEARAMGVDREADAIASGLAAAQAEVAAAKAAVKTAFETGDAEKLAEAQEKLGRAAADAREFERAQADLTDRKSREERAAPDKPDQPRSTSINDIIDGMAIMPEEKTWLKSHPDALTNPRQRARLDAAYFDAIDAGHARGTPEYFNFVGEKLGYVKAAAKPEPDADTERGPIVAAPVSRDNRSSVTGQVVNRNRIMLTPAQRALAADMGISDTEYARGLVMMEDEKRANPEKFAARG